MKLSYTIEVYRRLRLMPAAEAPIDAESWAAALCHPDDSDNHLPPNIRPTGIDGRWSLSLEVAVRRIWKQFRHFLLFLCSLHFSPLLIEIWPSINGVGMGFYHLPMEVEFPRAPDPPKGRH